MSTAPANHQLSRLLPTTLAPTLPSRASAPLSFLETIDRVEISDTVERDGVVYYVLDVFLEHHSSRIPTNKSRETKMSRVQPDYKVEHRFNDFADLRYQVWSYAQRQHAGSKGCAYCDEYMRFIVHSMSQPRLVVKLGTGVNKRKQLLATFCNEFVAMAIGAKMAGRSRNFTCDGYQAIPYIVERFFRQRV